jgi:hypothetical protein
MTELLKKAFKEAERLPPEDQDALGRTLLEELASEANWQDAFGTADEVTLGRLAADALKEHAAGQTKPLDPDTL